MHAASSWTLWTPNCRSQITAQSRGSVNLFVQPEKVEALPGRFRERGRPGTPLMWPWQWDLFRSGMAGRDELLLARHRC
jgi:hypothetical protein